MAIAIAMQKSGGIRKTKKKKSENQKKKEEKQSLGILYMIAKAKSQ